MTKKKAVGVPYEKSGVDRVHLPQKFSFLLWDGLKRARAEEGFWVEVWEGDRTPEGMKEVANFMRRGRAFALSFREHPKEFPEITHEIEVRRRGIKFRRNPDNPWKVQMKWHWRPSVWEWVEL